MFILIKKNPETSFLIETLHSNITNGNNISVIITEDAALYNILVEA